MRSVSWRAVGRVPAMGIDIGEGTIDIAAIRRLVEFHARRRRDASRQSAGTELQPHRPPTPPHRADTLLSLAHPNPFAAMAVPEDDCTEENMDEGGSIARGIKRKAVDGSPNGSVALSEVQPSAKGRFVFSQLSAPSSPTASRMHKNKNKGSKGAD